MNEYRPPLNIHYSPLCESCKAPFQPSAETPLCPRCGGYVRLRETLRQVLPLVSTSPPQ